MLMYNEQKIEHVHALFNTDMIGDEFF